MKRFATGLMALVLAFTLCAPAMAATGDYAMSIQVNGGSSATVARGSEVTVTLTLSQEGADTFDLYSMQDYVCFDPDYFAYVEDSLQVYTVGAVPSPVFDASAIAFPAGETELNRIYVNRAGNTPQALSSGVTVLTFQLEALKNGTTTLSHDKTEVFQTPGQLYTCALRDATVTISDTAGGGGTGGGGTGGGGGSTGGGSAGGGDVVIEEPDTPLAPLPFVDVPADAWYADAVTYVVNAGLMNGTSATTFSPNGTTDRAMLVTVLYRLEGSPSVTSYPQFSDVPGGTWYTDAVAWAAANGIVDGYGNGQFGPTDPVTREQTATILYRYVDYKGHDVSRQASLSGYTDDEAVSTWALDAMEWAVADGLISGTDTKALLPGGYAARSQTAQILMRLCESILKESVN